LLVLKEFAMPIYEFKCLKCQEYIEILVMGTNDAQVEMKCSKCGSPELERILSAASFNLALGAGAKTNAATQTRSCSSGSCTTWNLSGHSR
jgi:putative FmdB family regulatory protein